MESDKPYDPAENNFSEQPLEGQEPGEVHPYDIHQQRPPSLLLGPQSVLDFHTQSTDVQLESQEAEPVANSVKQRTTRAFALLIVLALAIALYFIWRSESSTTTVQPLQSTVQSFAPSPMAVSNAARDTPTSRGSQIRVYIIGAVKHPGIYSLPPGARVYELLQAAGGAQPGADLVALNLAAQLSDGQEIYVTKIGEPPLHSSTGAALPSTESPTPTLPVNINTASASEMQHQLHISSTTANNIVNYRVQHGPYSSITQLLQVVRKTTYDKIKSMITV